MKKLIALSILLFTILQLQAQSPWLSGYRFRKQIAFKKAMVHSSLSQISTHIVLVQLEHADLIYKEGAFDQSITTPNAYDIAFTTITNPATVLKFQISSYNPATGRLLCWVELPQINNMLSTNLNTTVYLYYGSTKLYSPLNNPNWSGVFEQIDHLDGALPGKLHGAVSLNGVSDYLVKPPTLKNSLFVSLWIKPEQIGPEQVIFANETTNAGFLLKIDALGRLVFQLVDAAGMHQYVATRAVNAGEWNAVAIHVKAQYVNFYPLTILINGVVVHSVNLNRRMVSSNEPIVIGRSKQGDRHFKGLIDEWRLGTLPNDDAIKTDYNIINNPVAFSIVGNQEENLIESPIYNFYGWVNSTWDNAANWEAKVVAPQNKNIRVRQGKELNIPDGRVINQLFLETKATANFLSTASIVSHTYLQAGAEIKGTPQTRLQLQGNLFNDGEVILDGANARLQVYGSRTAITFEGNGMMKVRNLEIDLPANNAALELKLRTELTASLRLFNGQLKTGGQLHLLAPGDTPAIVYPLNRESSITGDVHVQYHVKGNFANPASGRGWRLLSSPVFQSSSATNAEYGFSSLQNSVFVTGAGGVSRGFDPSPNNGATIYTHNQALDGTLTQKYVPIPQMDAKVGLGQGFFLFSRGDRTVPDAYLQQIVNRPFENPKPYRISYTGSLFKGPLSVTVYNKDQGGEGDGYNLLGNPYAAPIRWGSLVRENVGPNVWIFNSLNNDYDVSDDPDTIIEVGAGFFVRVNPRFQTGVVHFDENAKVVPQ